MTSRAISIGSLFLLLGCIVPGGGCRPTTTAVKQESGSTENVATPSMSATIQLNWYPEAEHGGFYAADVMGLFQAEGVTPQIVPGGRAVNPGGELELGRCNFAVVNADDVVLMRHEGADVVAVMAPMQIHPRCILVREDSPAKSLKDLKGFTLHCEKGRAFVEYMRQQGLLEGVQEAPYFGSIAPLATSPQTAIQGYVFSEPLLAKEQGISTRNLMVSDLGFNPYASVLITTGRQIREKPALVQAVVKASIEGWQKYLDDPERTNARILAENGQGLTAAALQFGVEQMQPLCITAEVASREMGRMDSARWDQLVRQLEDLKLIDRSKVKASDCYTTKFLPSGSTGAVNRGES
jgi:NitT/TauT family transport system substrate-binding protein